MELCIVLMLAFAGVIFIAIARSQRAKVSPATPVRPPRGTTTGAGPFQTASAGNGGTVSATTKRGYAAHLARQGTSSMGWVPPGQSTTVGGYTIPDGLVFVGSALPSIAATYRPDPALIDPKLPVDRASPDREGNGLSYWPSYSDISPACRAAYLEWLSGGRRDPRASIGYVFLFLYGLERRVLIDADVSSEAVAELPTIVAELERLLSIYTASKSFQKYASRLLAVALIRSGANLEPRHVRASAGTGDELPLVLRCRIGAFAAAGAPLPVEWALAWVDSDKTMPTRTPSERCRAEFLALFAARYASLHGPGLLVKPCKREVASAHQASSGTFAQAPITVKFPFPDVTSLVGPRRTIESLVADCCEALEPLSRLRGKAGSETNRLAAIAAWPADLLETQAPAELGLLRDALKGALGDRDVACTRAADLIGSLWPTGATQLTKAQAVELIRAIGAAGYCVEPDVRFGGPVFGLDSQIAVFAKAGTDMSVASKHYSDAALLLRLGACVANSDGTLGAQELAHMERHLEKALHLETAERHRLRAYIRWLLVEPPDAARLKKRLEALSESEREDAGRFLVQIALADGTVDASEVKNLAKMYRLLGLDDQRVHADIHDAQAMVNDSELVRIRGSGVGAADVAIPPPQTPERPERRGSKAARPLDMAAVEAKLRESAQVAAMLESILADDEVSVVAPTVEPVVGEQRIRSLDAQHSRLLVALGAQSSWTRDQFVQLATGIGLMPDGALEVLNELAFEVCDEALFEGDDPIETNPNVFKELVQ